MPIVPTDSVAPLSYTAQDIITNALIEAEWVGVGDPPPAEDSNFALSKLNDLLDEWAAQKRYVYATSFQLFTLTPGLSPHTIGPSDSATFAVTQRPIRIESASLVLAGTTDLDIDIQDADWWAINSLKGQTTDVPTDLFYSPDMPDGSLYFWPVPSSASQVRLELWGILGQFVSLSDSFSFPPGYRKALTLALARSLAGPRSNDPGLQAETTRAIIAVQGNNAKSPRIATKDYGMPGGRRKSGFNWMTGDIS